ncbi:MAG: D-aminoacylase [Thermodesulfovibrionales bacterium]
MAIPFDLIFTGGMIIDGSGRPGYAADLAVTGDRIAAIGRIDPSDARKTIPVAGLAVAPGFIDAHSHSDFTLLADPRAEGKITQGVTTEINGNCGMSAAPLTAKARERREPDLRDLGIASRWQSLAEYFRLLEYAGPSVNTAFLAGHGNIRGCVVGYEDRRPSDDEIRVMDFLLREALEQGAIGLSTGLIYPPGTYADTDELAHLCSGMSALGGIYTSHMRSEGDSLNQAVQEVIEIGARSGVPVHVSHVKTAGEENWHKAESVIEQMENARLNGIRVSCDCYPYTSSSTDLDSILPSWTYDGGNERELERLRNPVTRDRIRAEMSGKTGRPGYWDKIVVSSVSSGANAWMEGKTLAEIGRTIGLDPLDAVFRVLQEEELRVGAIFRSMSEENKRKFLSLPYCMIGSDSSSRSFDGPTRRGKPHPRTFGTFPRFLRRYAIEQGVMELHEAVRRMTSLPAATFGIQGRGLLREGMYADIVVFEPGSVTDMATYEEPFRGPEGIRFVLVNGEPVVAEGRPTGMRPGRVLRRPA